MSIPTSLPDGAVRLPTALTAAATIASATAEFELHLQEVDLDEDNARRYDDPDLLQRLIDNIAEHGLINAVIVCRDPQTGRYRLIAGHRRCQAVRSLGRKTIRARVLGELTDDQRSDLALSDNLARNDLSDFELGLAALDFIARTGNTATAFAKKYGVSDSAVSRARALICKLPAEVQNLIRQGQLPPAVARLLTPLSSDEAKLRFALLYAQGLAKSSKELAEAIRAEKNGHAAPSAFTYQENGVRIAVTLTAGLSPTQAVPVLRSLAKQIQDNPRDDLSSFKGYLGKKTRKESLESQLKAAEQDLRDHSSPPTKE